MPIRASPNNYFSLSDIYFSVVNIFHIQNHIHIFFFELLIDKNILNRIFAQVTLLTTKRLSPVNLLKVLTSLSFLSNFSSLSVRYTELYILLQIHFPKTQQNSHA